MKKVQLTDLIHSLKDYFVKKVLWDRQDLNPGGADYECLFCGETGWETDYDKEYKLVHNPNCFVYLAELYLDQNEGIYSIHEL